MLPQQLQFTQKRLLRLQAAQFIARKPSEFFFCCSVRHNSHMSNIDDVKLAQKEEHAWTRLPTSRTLLQSLISASPSLSFEAFGMTKIFPAWTHKSNIQVLVVGARDESSLPMPWWQSVLFSFQSCEHLSIEMLGPDISSKWDKQVVEYIATASTEGNEGSKYYLAMRSPTENKTLLTNHQHMHQKLQAADTFVLFNPGFGASESMKSQWRESLLHMLQTRKPILCTAHSEADLDRDLAFLDELLAEDAQDLGEPLEVIQHPEANPFCSLSKVIDTNEAQGNQVIAFNSYIYSFRMK